MPVSRTASMASCRLGRPVEGVEDAEQVDAGLGRLLDERADDVVGIIRVADGVGGAQQHLEEDVGHALAQVGEAVPRRLLEEAHGRVERGAAPHLQREQARHAGRRSTGRSAACRRCACAWPAATGGRRGRSCRSRAAASAPAPTAANFSGPSSWNRSRVPGGGGVGDAGAAGTGRDRGRASADAARRPASPGLRGWPLTMTSAM